MYLAEVFVENFRVFGSEQNGKALSLTLQRGLNVLVGENDSGKSAVVDAIRFCLWTTSQDYHRFTADDFHCGPTGRVKSLRIRCKFADLAVEDQATFLEWLSLPKNGPPVLFLHLQATLLDGHRHGRVAIVTHAGEHGEGPAIEGGMREMLKVTYLKPLRDAEQELRPGRNSRLSQILISHPEIAKQANDDFDPTAEESGTTLVGIVKRAEHHLGLNPAVLEAKNSINTNYLRRFQIGQSPLTSEVAVAGDTTLSKILEKLELAISKPENCSERTRRGLGFNNALFMSAELLLLGSREAYPTLLIEEPEAHLHPQMQANVIALLSEKSDTARLRTPINPSITGPALNQDSDSSQARPVQVLMTTHSPNLASSVPLERITILSGGQAFSLLQSETELSPADYAFLERFLDATKANLFFAKGVALVEGDAENLLLPTLAEKIGFSFREAGVSVINVGHVGLFRYSNIFRRKDKRILPVRVACIRDRDICPDYAGEDLRGNLPKLSDLTGAQLTAHVAKLKENDGEAVETFVSDCWTFEYDLAAASWEAATIMHQAIGCAQKAKSSWPDEKQISQIREARIKEIAEWKANKTDLGEAAVRIYAPLRKEKASKSIAAQFAAMFFEQSTISDIHLPKYLVQSFKHLTGK